VKVFLTRQRQARLDTLATCSAGSSASTDGLVMLREVVEAYREERPRARRRMTRRLRRQERKVREVARVRCLDHAELGCLAAVRDELRSRGIDLPPIKWTWP
jgi:hypothetical protein